MIERDLAYPGYLLHFQPESPSDSAILLLHGFPAMSGTKNLDLADLLFRELHCHVWLLHYRGLGDSPGTFSFTQSIEEAVQVANRVADTLTGRRQLTVIGHSWGGLTGVNVAARLPGRLRALLLLSPFVYAQPNLENWFVAEVKRDLPTVFGATKDEDVRANWEAVKAQYLPLDQVDKIPHDLPIGVLQSKIDPTTPAEHTKQLVAALPPATRYRELDLDHSFTQNRRLLAQEVVTMLRKLHGA